MQIHPVQGIIKDITKLVNLQQLIVYIYTPVKKKLEAKIANGFGKLKEWSSKCSKKHEMIINCY